MESAAKTATKEIVCSVEEGVRDVQGLEAVKKAQRFGQIDQLSFSTQFGFCAHPAW